MTIPGYEVFEELSQTELFILRRGRREKDGLPVLLKTSRAFADAELLEREFEILSGLAISGVPRAYELLRHQGSRCLALEDFGGKLLQTFIGEHGRGLDFFFKLGIQLSAILSQLHRRDIIHRNITPRSILVHPATGEAQLSDFAFASRTESEAQSPLSIQRLRESLPYLSPEQTGRMNRATDYCADFYSLGIIFYELLTGSPPFQSDDSLELIHWHIARTPLPPAKVAPEVPEPVSEIVIKLLAKNAEARYRSAAGIREDLETCAREWAARRQIARFAIGQRDVSDRFLISQKLYGRDREVEALLGAFDHVCQGQSAMMIVAGYSGIGKTSLIHELYKPIVRARGYFISGKFDQVVRSTPFGALIQAFRGLVRQLLTESEERFAGWRDRLSDALGTNGGVLAEVIPEIELILGKQLPPPALRPTEALNRFQLVFQNFVGALAREEHPLVIFLDDLQWADSATLGLLQPLLTSSEVRHLFLMGAYRDNEVDADHALRRTLDALESAGVPVHSVALGPLQLPDLTLLIRDTLRGEPSEADPLARLLLEKTGGNPFFVIHFLKSLKQEGYLEFDYERGRWNYRIEAIAGAAMTDNVIGLMTRKLRRLSARTQRALTLAACIGNRFDLSALAIVNRQSPEEAADDLREALDEGLILSSARRYDTSELHKSEIAADTHAFAFLHDRVQQAAYALIPDEQNQSVHLTVGRLLLERSDPSNVEERLFDIAHHLNLGSSLIDDEAERATLARLNLSAGQKAKSSTAYESALAFLKAGLSLLAEDRWDSDYDLMFALNLEAAECEYLCGHFDEAERRFALLLERAQSRMDKSQVHSLRIVQCESLSRYADALASARESLALFGVSFPDLAQEKQAALENEIASIQSSLEAHSIASLINLPVMADPEIRMVMNILTAVWPSAYLAGDEMLARLISAMMVRLSLVHGNSEESAYGYVTHAITVGSVREDYESAYEFGRLALRVNERFKDSKRRAKIHQQFQAHVNLWRRPLQTCIPHAREALRSGLETGDFTYANYGAFTESWAAMVTTQDLAQFVRDYSTNLALIRKLQVASFADAQKIILNWARSLRGETDAPLSLSDESFDANGYVEAYRNNPFFMMFYFVARLHLCYTFEEYGKALEAARSARAIAHHLSGTIWPVLLDFWSGLTLAVLYGDAAEDEQNDYLDEMEKEQARLAVLAENCPENFLCQSLLLSAETERVAGRQLSALDLYERAVRYAEETRMIQHQAIANELLARFWLKRGQEKIASVLMAEARNRYAQWGAVAKVESLERKYLEVPGPWSVVSLAEPLKEVQRTPEPVSIDISTVSKAAHAIAVEIETEGLLRKLIKIAIENAGAERGIFLREKDGRLLIEAEGRVNSDEVKVLQSAPLDESAGLSAAVIRYVRKTGESVVIDDAASDERFTSDPDTSSVSSGSILCVPVVHQGKLGGILYLENNLATGAFTPERIEIMRTLSATAAISLEKAQLYEEMKQEAALRQEAEETLRSIVEGTAGVTGDDFFYSLVRHLASALQVRYAFVTVCRGQKKTRARTLAFWDGNEFGENFEYDLSVTPCKKVLDGETCFYSENLQKLFPEDRELCSMRAESFLGFPMFDASGEVIGHLAVLDDRPMDVDPRRMSALKIFAARAGAELERLQAEEDLRTALAQVGALKNRLQAENVYLQEEIRREHNFEEIVGSSPALLDALKKVEMVAPTDSTVLVSGETGTGKELIARAIHNRSDRMARPLVKVNCGAISAGLVESELFGHVKGAFTGAIGNRVGRFELADKGTLFLDEVSELPLDTQVKLLRVLQEGEFEPVGSSRTIRVNVRIIAATNRKLEEAVREGRFRQDLFYRLNVFPLQVPPLRERRSDIAQLVSFFLSRFSKKFGKKVNSVSQEAMDLLMNYSWPGNVRELQNIIERGVVLCQSSALNLDRDLFPAPATDDGSSVSETSAASTFLTVPTIGPASSRTPNTLEEVERSHILNVLEQTDWVVEGPKGAAKVLNLHPNTLRSRMKKLSIKRSGHEIS